MSTLNQNSILRPGTFVTEQATGFIPVELAPFAATYMFGAGDETGTNTTKDTPVQVTSADDFTAKFGVSASLRSVQLYFANCPTGILYFIDVDCSVLGVPTAAEYVASIGKALTAYDAIGFLIAPQAFSTLTTQSDRTSVAVALRDLATTHNMMAIIDAGPSGTIDTAAEFVTEGTTYTSPAGHIAYYAPYVVDLLDNVIPPSAGICGLAIRRYRTEGFQQPPAGATFPLFGVKDVAVRITDAEQEVGNPQGINYIRNLPNLGVVVWGGRTRSASQYFRFVNTRIILNVLERTLRDGFNTLIFSAVDGQGVIFSRIRETINQVCYRLWQGGAFYGRTPDEAYRAICDETNNPALDLEAGVVRADVWVVPAPTLERLFIQVNRTPIGQVETLVTQALGQA